jgi:hypothetical protein
MTQGEEAPPWSSGPRKGPRRGVVRVAVLFAAIGAATSAGLGSGVSAQAPQLVRYPYLTDVTPSSVTVNFATSSLTPAPAVLWGASGTSCVGHSEQTAVSSFTVSGTSEYQRRATLKGLSPNSSYCYRLSQSGIDLLAGDPSPAFTTALSAGAPDPFEFAVFGDWGDTSRAGGGNIDQAALLGMISQSGARFVVSTGDNAYPSGRQTNYGDLVHTGQNVSGVFAANFWTKVGARIPAFMPMGNHGFTTEGANAALLNWPQTNVTATSGGRAAVDTYCCNNGTTSGRYPSIWYAFDYGRVRFYVLEAAWGNSNLGSATTYQNDHDAHWTVGSAEYQWLTNDMAAHRGTPKFAFFHYPLYSDNSNDTSDIALRGLSQLEGLLAVNDVRLVFNGHAHLYERNKTGFPTMAEYVTGGAGAKLEPVNRCSAFDLYAVGWSYSIPRGSSCNAPTPRSSSQVFHYLRVGVEATTVTVTPTDESGNSFDVQTYPLP